LSAVRKERSFDDEVIRKLENSLDLEEVRLNT
jgi:hypothetical protein